MPNPKMIKILTIITTLTLTSTTSSNAEDSEVLLLMSMMIKNQIATQTRPITQRQTHLTKTLSTLQNQLVANQDTQNHQITNIDRYNRAAEVGRQQLGFQNEQILDAIMQMRLELDLLEEKEEVRQKNQEKFEISEGQDLAAISSVVSETAKLVENVAIQINQRLANIEHENSALLSLVRNLDKDEGKEVQVFHETDKIDKSSKNISENVSLPASSQFLFTIGGHPANFIPSELVPLTKGDGEVSRRLQGPPTNEESSENYKIGWYRGFSSFFNHKILVCGGQHVASRKCYQMRKNSNNTRNVATSLKLPETRAGSVATITNAGLVVTGGYSGEKKSVTQNVLQLRERVFDVKTGKGRGRDSFVEIIGLKLGRFRHSCCFQKSTELLICSGGMAKSDKNKKSKSIDTVFVLTAGKRSENATGLGKHFEYHSTLPEPLYDHYMVIGDDDSLYILGGNDGKAHPPVNRILKYEEVTQQWEVLNEELPIQVISASGEGKILRSGNAVLEFNSNENMTILADGLVERGFQTSVVLENDWLDNQ